MRTLVAALAASMLLALAPAAMAAPTADFDVNPDPPIAGTAAQFTSTSTADPGREIAQVQWDFDNDGGWDATVSDPPDDVTDPVSHTYPSAGTWSVRMRVVDDAPVQPESDELVRLIQVAAPNVAPVAQFSFAPLDPVEGQEIFLESFSYDPDGTIAGHAWDIDGDGFDDGTGSALALPLGLSAGTHTVRLRVTDGVATNVAQEEIVVGPAPADQLPEAQFSISPTQPLIDDLVTFESFSYDPEGEPVTLRWDLDGVGDFNDGTGTTASRIFSSVGQKTVRLEVTDAADQVQTATRSFTVGQQPPPVNQLPVAQFAVAPLDPVAGQEIFLRSFSYDPDGTNGAIAGQAWDIDGDGFDDGTDPTLTLADGLPEGTHTVRLRVTDADGATDDAEEVVVVGPAPATDPPVAAVTTTPTTSTTSTPPAASTPAASTPAQPSLLSPWPVVRLAGTLRPRGTRIGALEVRAPRGSTVTVNCLGKRCPFRRQRKTAGTRLVRFPDLRTFLPARTVIAIAVTKDSFIGRHTRFLIRADKAPKRTDSCLLPGKSKPSACPSA